MIKKYIYLCFVIVFGLFSCSFDNSGKELIGSEEVEIPKNIKKEKNL